MVSTRRPLRILLVATDDEQAYAIQEALAASWSPQFHLDRAVNGWEAQRKAGDSGYQALVVDHEMSDIDGESLVGRLKGMGIGTPVLLLTSPGAPPPAGSGDAYFSKPDASQGQSLCRAIEAMVTIDHLYSELHTARQQAAHAATTLATLAHDLATPLGVVMGLSQVLLAEDIGLNQDDRSCLEDVSREAVRACEILTRLSQVEATVGAVLVTTTLAPAQPASGRKAVLIADDDAATRRLVKAALASDQYSVLEAADGEEAWCLIRAHHPAVAILDWQMPVYTGLELTDVIKGDPLVRGMTVIMLTGRSAAADREAGARAHADLYLSKPFSPQDLVQAVEQALGISQAP